MPKRIILFVLMGAAALILLILAANFVIKRCPVVSQPPNALREEGPGAGQAPAEEKEAAGKEEGSGEWELPSQGTGQLLN